MAGIKREELDPKYKCRACGESLCDHTDEQVEVCWNNLKGLLEQDVNERGK